MTCSFVYLFSKRANPLPALSLSSGVFNSHTELFWSMLGKVFAMQLVNGGTCVVPTGFAARWVSCSQLLYEVKQLQWALCFVCSAWQSQGGLFFGWGAICFCWASVTYVLQLPFWPSPPLFQSVLQWKSWHNLTMWRCLLLMNVLSHLWLNVSTSLIMFLLPELIRAGMTPSSTRPWLAFSPVSSQGGLSCNWRGIE